MEKSQQEKTKSIYLCPENLAVPVVPEILTPLICQICTGVVIRPVECQKCETLFCESEIREQKEAKCPLCREQKWRNGSSIHKSYRSALSNLVFKCTGPGCTQTEPLSYEKYIKHLEEGCSNKGSSNIKVQNLSNQPQTRLSSSFVSSGVLIPPIFGRPPYYKYYYLSEGNPPTAYNESQNATINMNLQHGRMQFELQDTYHINLANMTQENIYTQYRRGITRQLVADHQPRPWWFVEATDNPYHALEADASNLFEKNFQEFSSGRATGRFGYSFKKWNYEVDLNSLVQTNVKSHTSRKIFRAVI